MDGWIDRWLLDEAVLKWRESCPYSACQLVSLTQNKPGLYPITPSEPSHTLQWELLVMHVYASLFFYFLRMHSWYAVHSHISVFDWVLCKCVQPHISAFGLNAFSVVSCFVLDIYFCIAQAVAYVTQRPWIIVTFKSTALMFLSWHSVMRMNSVTPNVI